MKINKIKNQFGVTAIEYALLSTLIAVVVVTGVSASGSGVSKTLCTVSSKIGASSGCSSASSSSSSNSGSSSSYTDTLDLSFVPKSEGGTNDGKIVWPDPDGQSKSTAKNYYHSVFDVSQSLASELSYLNNSSDPITKVFGAYDLKTGKALTDINDVISGLSENSSPANRSYMSDVYSDFSLGLSSGDDNRLEVATQSGKIYTINVGNDPRTGSVIEQNSSQTTHSYDNENAGGNYFTGSGTAYTPDDDGSIYLNDANNTTVTPDASGNYILPNGSSVTADKTTGAVYVPN